MSIFPTPDVKNLEPSTQTPVERALDCARFFGQTDGGQHKMWVIDQMVRSLCGSDELYAEFVRFHNADENGPDSYVWDIGVAP